MLLKRTVFPVFAVVIAVMIFISLMPWPMIGKQASHAFAAWNNAQPAQQASSANVVADDVAQPAPPPWTDPKELPTAQSMKGAITLGEFGIFSWQCMGRYFLYMFTPTDQSKIPWQWKNPREMLKANCQPPTKQKWSSLWSALKVFEYSRSLYAAADQRIMLLDLIEEWLQTLYNI